LGDIILIIADSDLFGSEKALIPKFKKRKPTTTGVMLNLKSHNVILYAYTYFF